MLRFVSAPLVLALLVSIPGSATGRKTLAPYRRCPGGHSPIGAHVRSAGALSIRPFQVSRWRLRRTRHLWVFNGILVLPYYLSGGIAPMPVVASAARR